MSTYQCQSCAWKWDDSSFFAGVKADGCPKCKSNIIDRIERPKLDAPDLPDEHKTSSKLAHDLPQDNDDVSYRLFQRYLDSYLVWTGQKPSEIAYSETIKEASAVIQAIIDKAVVEARIDELNQLEFSGQSDGMNLAAIYTHKLLRLRELQAHKPSNSI